MENYTLWAALVMDSDGIGQPVAFGNLCDEQESTMQNFPPGFVNVILRSKVQKPFSSIK